LQLNTSRKAIEARAARLLKADSSQSGTLVYDTLQREVYDSLRIMSQKVENITQLIVAPKYAVFAEVNALVNKADGLNATEQQLLASLEVPITVRPPMSSNLK